MNILNSFVPANAFKSNEIYYSFITASLNKTLSSLLTVRWYNLVLVLREAYAASQRIYEAE